METARVGKVAVENTAYHFDKAYDLSLIHIYSLNLL